MKKQFQLTIYTVFMVLTGLTGYGQNVGDIFTVDGITYEVTSLGNPNMVTITETSNENREDFTIPENVTYSGNDFTVTVIGAGAFGDNGLTNVTIPSSVIQITANAFTDNPDLKRVVSKSTNPPRLDPSAFGDRSDIALIVPDVSISIYENVAFGWTGFKSITGEVSDVTEGLEYNVTNTNPNTAEVIGYQGTATDVNIPETVTIGTTDYTVTRIGDNAFNPLPPFNNKALTSVTIPNSVTSIGNSAFNRSQLQGHLEIPNSVTSIENDAFNSRDVDAGLTSVTIPNSVTRIGQRAFAGNRLKSVTLPDKLQVLEMGVFVNNSLNEVTIPESVTEIQRSAFNANKLSRVHIPSNVTKIGQTAFMSKNYMVIVGLSSSDPPVLDISNGDCNRVFKDRCEENGSFTVIVPRGARGAYLTEDHWKDLNIIEELHFEGSFTYSDVPLVKKRSMHYQVISDLDRTVRVTGRVANGPLDVIIPEKVFHGVPYTVTAIGDFAFENNQLTSVEIPETVTSIGKFAFDNNQFTEVVIPNSVTTIGASAFRNSGLTGHLEIPNSVTEIRGGAFSRNKLTSVTIPDNPDFTKLDIGIFQDNLLTEVTIPANVEFIAKGSFSNNLELVTLVMKNPGPIDLSSEAFDFIIFGEDFISTEDRRPLIDVIVPRSDPPGRNKHEYLTSRGWGDHGFKSIKEEGDIGETFEKAGITYKITEFNPNTVTIIDNENTGDLTIPMKVERLEKGPFAISEERLVEYTITDIEAGAFQ
ncbi:leucine-rich repeat domain-containing protein, partial [Aquimarina gracilis]